MEQNVNWPTVKIPTLVIWEDQTITQINPNQDLGVVRSAGENFVKFKEDGRTVQLFTGYLEDLKGGDL